MYENHTRYSEMNLIMASDDNYAGVMAASINSIAQNNSEAMKIYIIDDGISNFNKKKIFEIISRYNNLDIQFIDFGVYGKKIKKLVKTTNPPLPLITFARLFISEMISDDMVLYVDCDTICCGDISEFWNTDMSGKMIAGVWDTVDEKVKAYIGLNKNDRYINAGIILIDLKKWRENDCTSKAIDYINKKGGSVMHNDQGVINALFRNDIKIIEPKYNAMTPVFLISPSKILKYFNLEEYYSYEEILEAKRNPIFIHFVRFTTSRPWEEKCCHPLKNEFVKNYVEVYGNTPKLKPYNLTKGQKVLYWVINNCPYFIYDIIIRILSLKGKKNG